MNRKCICVVVAVGLALAASGCGGSGTSKESRSEAAALVHENQQYMQRIRPLIAHEESALSSDFGNCSVVKTSDHRLPSELAMQLVNFVGTYKAIASAYADHARRVRKIAASDPVFRQAADYAVQLAARYQVLANAHPGYCRVFKRWHAARWRPSFDIRPVVGVPPEVLDRSGYDESPLEKAAHRALTAAAARLQRLGASKSDAQEFVTGIDLFAPNG